MNLNLMDRVAIVGGSSKGLGRGCAVQLAKEGVKIVLCATDQTSLDTTAQFLSKLGVDVLPLNVNMSSRDDNEKIVEETIKKFGRIDILVNNSGGPPPGTFFEFTEEQWVKSFEDILLYVIRMIKLVVPYMKGNSFGRIINLTSLSVKEPVPTLILSNVFRTGVISLARSLTKELIKSGITINNICPGAFKTDRALELIAKAAKDKNISTEEVEKISIQNFPLGRYQTPEELGNLVSFLCSELAEGISGTTIQIDGGIYNGLF